MGGKETMEEAVLRRAAGEEPGQEPGQEHVVALAGNPNVGKSTVFNALTGMRQHTGNWPGKTVSNAQGRFSSGGRGYLLVDTPGAYSLMAHSAEEEVARNFICFGGAALTVAVCDATCLERNLNLVLQIMEITPRVVVCVNLLDEAKKKHIRLDLPLLSQKLGAPVVGVTAHKKKSLRALVQAIDAETEAEKAAVRQALRIAYAPPLEEAISLLEPLLAARDTRGISARWLALRLLEQDSALEEEIARRLGPCFLQDAQLADARQRGMALLAAQGIEGDKLKDLIVAAIVGKAEELCHGVVSYEKAGYDARDRKIDKILTGKLIGYPLMLALLALIFWLTVSGANYPSQLLSGALFRIEDRLTELFIYLNAPAWLHGILVLGLYRVLAWVVSVMLPPMAIFFPLFTLLEDLGYLPRVAYNLDKPFKRCHACGKQALTMCMGFGCNAVGVIGCRIIDSPRERLLAILTNSFVPCNGRFPTLITLITIFFIGTAGGAFSSLGAALLLTLLILLGVLVTLGVTRLLSATLLKGVPSSFTLELPPYRRPQIGRVIVRSVFDRTLFVLRRAVAVAAPAGILIWLLANISVEGASLLAHCAGFLQPFAEVLGLDGVILLAFILSLPANEILLPLIVMAYLAQGSITEFGDLGALRQLLLDNGWTAWTAAGVMLFSLMHWPCSTTLLTIKKETGSWKWTALALLIPTLAGCAACFLLNIVAGFFS